MPDASPFLDNDTFYGGCLVTFLLGVWVAHLLFRDKESN